MPLVVSSVKLQQQHNFIKEELMAEDGDWVKEIAEACEFYKAFSELKARGLTGAAALLKWSLD